MGPDPRGRIDVVRTEDGARYEVESDAPYGRAAAGIGERARIDNSLGEVIAQISRSVAARHASDAKSVTIQFGITLTSEAGFVVSRGRDGSHFVVTMEFADGSDA